MTLDQHSTKNRKKKKIKSQKFWSLKKNVLSKKTNISIVLPILVDSRKEKVGNTSMFSSNP
jgi:SPX domain protein involved in polyphosphate accumulation